VPNLPDCQTSRSCGAPNAILRHKWHKNGSLINCQTSARVLPEFSRSPEQNSLTVFSTFSTAVAYDGPLRKLFLPDDHKKYKFLLNLTKNVLNTHYMMDLML